MHINEPQVYVCLFFLLFYVVFLLLSWNCEYYETCLAARGGRERGGGECMHYCIEWNWKSSWFSVLFFFSFLSSHSNLSKTFSLLNFSLLIKQWIYFWFDHVLWSLLREMSPKSQSLCSNASFVSNKAATKRMASTFACWQAVSIYHGQRVQWATSVSLTIFLLFGYREKSIFISFYSGFLSKDL